MSESLKSAQHTPACTRGDELEVPDSIAALQGLWDVETEVDQLLQQAAHPSAPDKEFEAQGCAVNALSHALEKYKEWTHSARIEPARIEHAECDDLALGDSRY